MGRARGVRDRGRDDARVGRARGGLACAPSLPSLPSLPVRVAHPRRMLGLRRLCSPSSRTFIASARDAAGPSVMCDTPLAAPEARCDRVRALLCIVAPRVLVVSCATDARRTRPLRAVK
jgi:hypothetical protein